jgi:hypothetical protein
VRALALLVLAALAAPVRGEEVATGQTAQLRRVAAPRYAHVYSVYATDDDGVMVLAFGDARVGEALDLVDERGWLGRLLVDHVETRGCGAAHYLVLRARFVGHAPVREVVGRALALAPAQRAGVRVHILPAADVGDAPAGRDGLLAIDVDGDGRADLLHYLQKSCTTPGATDDNATCFETWRRSSADGGWRRIERVEFPSCT